MSNKFFDRVDEDFLRELNGGRGALVLLENGDNSVASMQMCSLGFAVAAGVTAAVGAMEEMDEEKRLRTALAVVKTMNNVLGLHINMDQDLLNKGKQ